jgi:hypothetical protein
MRKQVKESSGYKFYSMSRKQAVAVEAVKKGWWKNIAGKEKKLNKLIELEIKYW